MQKITPAKPYKFSTDKQYPIVLYCGELYIEVSRNSKTVELVSARDNSLIIGVKVSSENTPFGFTKKIPSGILEYCLKRIKDKTNGIRRILEQTRSVYGLPA